MKYVVSIFFFFLTFWNVYAQSKADLMGFAQVKDTAEWVYIDNLFNTYMRKEVYLAYVNMKEAAAQDGVILNLRTCYRSFDRQKSIWEKKWKELSKKTTLTYTEKAKCIMETSSMPGTSRHHWGTDMDFNSLDPNYFTTNPTGIRLYKWLVENAASFGFYQPYCADRLGGYLEEKWHWSYYPLASVFLEKYMEIISYNDITGFSGSSTAVELEVIDKWVRNIK